MLSAGGVIMIIKLSDAKRWYSVREQELLASTRYTYMQIE